LKLQQELRSWLLDSTSSAISSQAWIIIAQFHTRCNSFQKTFSLRNSQRK
jgi:hypothetical protein